MCSIYGTIVYIPIVYMGLCTVCGFRHPLGMPGGLRIYPSRVRGELQFMQIYKSENMRTL